jgi:DNA mismatch endonuclease, patch repair protein
MKTRSSKKELRSRIMASIRGKDTTPELLVRSFLHRSGFRFRAHKRIEGIRPDIVLPKYNAVVMIHGCFWHQHKGCSKAGTPRTRKEFWKQKFRANRKRDKAQNTLLLESGWRVAIIWECALLPRSNALGRLISWLNGRRRFLEIE